MPKPARCQPFIGFLEAVMLRRPHLVLADFGGDDRIAVLRRLPQRLDGGLRHDFLPCFPGNPGNLVARQPSIRAHQSCRSAFFVLLRLPDLDDILHRPARIGIDREVNAWTILVDRAAVDIDMDFLRVRRKASSRPVTDHRTARRWQ